MATPDLYRVDNRQPRKKHHWWLWLIILLLIILLLIGGFFWIRSHFKPNTVIKQSQAKQTTVSYASQTKHYDEGDFSVDLPSTLQSVPRPAGPYKLFDWQASSNGTNGEELEIFEDTIPPNFAVNRVVIVEGQGDHVVTDGTASDNCAQYTVPGQQRIGATGALAKWQGVEFVCDLGSTARDVVGSSSTDGMNIVRLQSPSTGASHTFLFAMINENNANPDYTPLYDALNSFKMQ